MWLLCGYNAHQWNVLRGDFVPLCHHDQGNKSYPTWHLGWKGFQTYSLFFCHRNTDESILCTSDHQFFFCLFFTLMSLQMPENRFWGTVRYMTICIYKTVNEVCFLLSILSCIHQLIFRRSVSLCRCLSMQLHSWNSCI